MKVVINRVFSDGHATLGLLSINEVPILSTLEPAWKENENNISCIPTGQYRCKKVFKRYTSGGSYIPETFEVMDVPGRSGILFHIGNFHSDTEGCILLGRGFCGGMISDSRKGFEEFIGRTMSVDALTLNIRDSELSW